MSEPDIVPAIIGDSLTRGIGQIIWCPARFPTSTVTPASLLPTAEEIPASYAPAMVQECGTSWRRIPWTDDDSLTCHEAVAVYTPDDTHAHRNDNIGVCVVLAGEDNRSAGDLDVLHDLLLWEEFDGEPSMDVYTEWVKTSLEEQSVDVTRRTTLCVRSPVLWNESWMGDDVSDLPYCEVAGVVEPTPWGVISVGARIETAPEEGQACTLRDDALASVRERVGMFPTPTPLRNALDDTDWSSLSPQQRREAVTAVAGSKRERERTVDGIADSVRSTYETDADDVEAVVAAVLDTDDPTPDRTTE